MANSASGDAGGKPVMSSRAIAAGLALCAAIYSIVGCVVWLAFHG